MVNPTYQSGFYAPGRGTALYPALWDGCVGAWNPGLGNTGLSLRDWSGNQNNGTLTNGPTWGVSGGRQALEFTSAASQDVKLPNLPSTSGGDVTVSGWIYLTASPGSTFPYILNDSTSSTTLELTLGWSNNKVRFYSGGSGLEIPYAYVLNDWRHLSGTVSGSVMRLYINGVLVATGSRTLSQTNTGGATIGSLDWNLSYISANLADIRIYNRALSANEIRTLAQRPGIAYERAPRKFYSLPAAAASSRQYRLFRPSILRGA